jgi:hypothetical protein
VFEEHRKDHESYRNRPHCFQIGPKTIAAVRLDVPQWHRTMYCLQQARTQLGTFHWTLWRYSVARTSTCRRIVEFCSYYTGCFRYFPAFFCSVHFNDQKYLTDCSVLTSAYYLGVILHTHASEGLETRAPRHEVKKRVANFPRDNCTSV